MIVDSPQNPRIQAAKRLQRRPERDETGLILVEGPHPVAEAIAAGLTVDTCFLLPDNPPPPGLRSEPIYVSVRAMAALATTASPPPIVAVVKRPCPGDWHACFNRPGQPPFLLVADALQDPNNLGPLLRAAAAFGVSDILLTGESVDPYSPKAIRASAGLVFRLSLSAAELLPWLDEARSAGMTVLATTGVPAAENYRTLDWRQPLALLLGSEGPGLPEALLTGDVPGIRLIRIPMAPGVDSLNVAMAGGILLSAWAGSA